MNIMVGKRRREVKRLIVVVMMLVSISIMAGECFAHGGGLDRRGGHYVRTPGPGRIVGTYHFHR